MKGNKEVEKDKKVFQIVMGEKIHSLLKKRSKDYKVKIGDFVEELITAFELKMQSGLDLLEIKDNSFPYINGVIFQLLKTGSIKNDWSKNAKEALLERGRFLKEQALLDGWKQSDIVKDDHDYYNIEKYMK